ncbi:MAG: hypothetical protein IT442_09565 [Phycisphaeraceae bacterium]|nr:hypothetical protein [Phycisphaeraceae bacterium]
MTTDADKIRYLADLAGWRVVDEANRWVDRAGRHWGWLPDYPNSLDDIARDLLPLLREKGWEYLLEWEGKNRHYFLIDDGKSWKGSARDPAPARAAFEAIWQALHGGEE